jgi:hypothetical protein
MITTSLSIPDIRRHLTASVIGRHMYLFGDTLGHCHVLTGERATA